MSERARAPGVFVFRRGGVEAAFTHRALNPAVDLAVAQTRARTRVRALLEGGEAAAVFGLAQDAEGVTGGLTGEDVFALSAVTVSAELAALVLTDWTLVREDGTPLPRDAGTVVRLFLGNADLFKQWSAYIEPALEDAEEGNVFAPSAHGAGTGAPIIAADAPPPQSPAPAAGADETESCARG